MNRARWNAQSDPPCLIFMVSSRTAAPGPLPSPARSPVSLAARTTLQAPRPTAKSASPSRRESGRRGGHRDAGTSPTPAAARDARPPAAATEPPAGKNRAVPAAPSGRRLARRSSTTAGGGLRPPPSKQRPAQRSRTTARDGLRPARCYEEAITCADGWVDWLERPVMGFGTGRDADRREKRRHGAVGRAAAGHGDGREKQRPGGRPPREATAGRPTAGRSDGREKQPPGGATAGRSDGREAYRREERACRTPT